MIGVIGAVAWTIAARRNPRGQWVGESLRVLLRYSIALGIASYGVAKILPMQFPPLNGSVLELRVGDLNPMLVKLYATMIVLSALVLVVYDLPRLLKVFVQNRAVEPASDASIFHERISLPWRWTVNSARVGSTLAQLRISLGGSGMVSTSCAWVPALLLVALQLVPIEHLPAQSPITTGHEHLTEVACVDVPPGEKRPEFGCFNVGVATGLHFTLTSVYWHLRAFPNRKAAEAVRSATGIVVEENGRAWLSEFGPKSAVPQGGDAIAIVGPLQLPAAKTYTAVLSYAVMRPGDNSRVHTHPGPEGWYVLAGEQCLETPDGAIRARAGGTATVRSNIPMKLNVTGKALRRAFALVIHDATQQRGTPSDWKPSGACNQ